MRLEQQQCKNYTLPALLSKNEIKLYFNEVPQWKMDSTEKNIYCLYEFKKYEQTLSFINSAANIATKENHHPTISFGYNSSKITYSTHSANGITLLDFICAAKIHLLYSKQDNK